MIRRPPRSTQSRSSAASDVYKRQEARRASREKLFSSAIRAGSDPTDFIAKVDDLRLRLADMGEEILAYTYADLLLSSFPKGFEFIKQMYHRDRSCTLDQIKQTATKFYIDELSRKSSGPSVAGRGAAMAAASNNVQCHRCKAYGHYQSNCPGVAKAQGPKRANGRAKAKVAILRPSGAPTTKLTHTATRPATNRRNSSSWLRTSRV